MSELLVIALGGNALMPPSGKQDIAAQNEACVAACRHIVTLMELGYRVVITHGNGPQVGFVLQRSEIARGQVHELSLDVCVADTQGAIGSMFQRALLNLTSHWKTPLQVVTLVTHVLVDPNDPDFQNPTKPIGSWTTDENRLQEWTSRNLPMIHHHQRGYRRVVPSPRPIEILELASIRQLLEQNSCVVACGGGGIPVRSLSTGGIEPLEAVIDKDRTSSLLAHHLDADQLWIATHVDKVYLDFEQPQQQALHKLSVSQAQVHIEQQAFGKGSMLPKVEAAVEFVVGGGRKAVIGHLDQLALFSQKGIGTHIVANEIAQ